MDEEFVDDFDVWTMANLIGKPLTDGHLRYHITNRPSAPDNPFEPGLKNVVHITGPDGSIVHPRIEGKKGSKVKVGQQSCFICRLYSLKIHSGSVVIVACHYARLAGVMVAVGGQNHALGSI
jgi:hypothetical protein